MKFTATFALIACLLTGLVAAGPIIQVDKRAVDVTSAYLSGLCAGHDVYELTVLNEPLRMLRDWDSEKVERYQLLRSH